MAGWVFCAALNFALHEQRLTTNLAFTSAQKWPLCTQGAHKGVGARGERGRAHDGVGRGGLGGRVLGGLHRGAGGGAGGGARGNARGVSEEPDLQHNVAPHDYRRTMQPVCSRSSRAFARRTRTGASRAARQSMSGARCRSLSSRGFCATCGADERRRGRARCVRRR